jgi:hypothetical protein
MDPSSPELYVPTEDCTPWEMDPPMHNCVHCSGWRTSLEKVSKRCDDRCVCAEKPASTQPRWYASKEHAGDVQRVLVTFINSVDELCDAEKVTREDSAILQAALDMIKRTEVVKSAISHLQISQ